MRATTAALVLADATPRTSPLRGGMHKLTARYIGPFRVLGTVNDNAVKLELPPLLGALHSTINISRLKLYRDGGTLFPTRPQRLYQPPAVETDTNGVDSYVVEAVLAQRRKGAQREMLVRWQGYGPEHDEWRPRNELAKSSPDLVAQFDALQQGGSSHAAQIAIAQLWLSSGAAGSTRATESSIAKQAEVVTTPHTSPTTQTVSARAIAAVRAAAARFGVIHPSRAAQLGLMTAYTPPTDLTTQGIEPNPGPCNRGDSDLKSLGLKDQCRLSGEDVTGRYDAVRCLSRGISLNLKG
jgi:hypothetical protein